MPNICVGVTVFNSLESTKESIRRWLKYLPKENVCLAIWDNSSLDYKKIDEYIKEKNFPNVTYLHSNHENCGQSASKNGLMKHFKQYNPEYVILSDGDVFCNWGCFDECDRIAKKYPNAGIITFHEGLNYETNTSLMPKFPTKDLDAFMVGDVPGTCWYLKYDVWEKIGGYDETFFFHSYDSDFCQRLFYNSNYRIYVSARRGIITHEMHGTKKQNSQKYFEMVKKDLATWIPKQQSNKWYAVPDLEV